MKNLSQKPTGAFIGASWSALILGVLAYIVGLYNSDMLLNEKGYYFAVLILSLFSAVSLQKSIRDKNEGIKITGIYLSISWSAFFLGLAMLVVGLFNATLELSEKGFYAMSYLMAIYASIAVQKNIRDLSYFPVDNDTFKSSKSEDVTD